MSINTDNNLGDKMHTPSNESDKFVLAVKPSTHSKDEGISKKNNMINSIKLEFPKALTEENRNTQSTKMLVSRMIEKNKLIIKPFSNKDNKSCFWVEASSIKGTTSFSVPASREIIQKLFRYLSTGIPQEIKFDQDAYTTNDTGTYFPLELFYEMVLAEQRINAKAIYLGDQYYNAFTNYKYGKVMFSLKLDDELKDFLTAKNLY